MELLITYSKHFSPAMGPIPPTITITQSSAGKPSFIAQNPCSAASLMKERWIETRIWFRNQFVMLQSAFPYCCGNGYGVESRIVRE